MSVLTRQNICVTQKVDWVQSDGSAWVDTKFFPQKEYSVEFSFSAEAYAEYCYFGCYRFDSTGPSNLLYNGIVSRANDRRMTIKVLPHLNDWFYWEDPNSINQYFDGKMHTFQIPLYDDQASGFSVCVDGDFKNFNRIWSYAVPDGKQQNISIFGGRKGDSAAYIPPRKVNFKFCSLKYVDKNGICDADFIAAKRGDEYGVLNKVTGEFLHANDGILSGGTYSHELFKC